MNDKYKVVTTAVENAEKDINFYSEDGWKPILMSTTQTNPSNQTPIAITIVFEKI